MIERYESRRENPFMPFGILFLIMACFALWFYFSFERINFLEDNQKRLQKKILLIEKQLLVETE